MSLNNDDLFLVNRGGTSYKTEYGIIKNDILGDSEVVIGPTPPANPNEGEFWFNSDDGRLYIWYVAETTGVVTTMGVQRVGSGYSTTNDVATFDGSGHGLTVDITVDGFGQIATAAVNQGGSGYKNGDIVFVDAGFQNGALTITGVNTAPVGQWVDVSLPGGGGGVFDGGNFTGGVTMVERPISATDFDLSTSNFWNAGAIDIPNPTNAVNGQSGLIRLTAEPTSWGANYKNVPGSVTPESIIPFYVKAADDILLGEPVEVN